MKTALLLFPPQADLQAERLLDLLPDADPPPDLLLLGEAPCPSLPSGLGQVFRLPGPEPNLCLDPWSCYQGAVRWARQGGYQLLLLSAGVNEDTIAASLAAELGGCARCGVTALRWDREFLIVRHPVCCMELEGEFTLTAHPALLTVQTPSRTLQRPGRNYEITCLPAGQSDGQDQARSLVCRQDKADSLLAAPSVFVAGRGVGGSLDKLALLADRLNARLGATRPVVFEGSAPMACLVGASAAVLAPRLCVVFGASGSAAFSVGVERSGTLIGVNLDAGAPLFNHCDYGLAADCAPLLDALLEQTEPSKEECTNDLE